GGPPADPADLIVLDESVDMALLVVLESMTPAERVAFVLHDVFRYPFAEIADVLGRTPAACKQLAASARRRVGAASAPAAPVTASGRAEVVRRVKEAWEAKDIATLVALLDPSAVLTADGGGTVGAVLRPVEGGARIARYLVAIAD
ncbi:sigma factor-like helix-turn-helix DNA-binding protein, partial [Streptomyces stelliscabiei]|uniref:sigma factor-like helix-turn-helix DNA-binding protein n=1 Tax=Streptomyces stelliscabiei TaxID=146820 RepID=UPI0006A09B17